jgi:perosamine synthetase
MKHGEMVSAFEKEFADYVGAQYAIAMTNGTVTLEVALRAAGVDVGETVVTTPLTMSATSIAILNVGARPAYNDIDPKTWLLNPRRGLPSLMVSLYGLHAPASDALWIDDAAETVRPHRATAFTSYSFQRSKILSTGEGGMLVTNDLELATRARSIASLGYDMAATQSRIDVSAIKSPSAVRHVRWPAINARMNDVTAQEGLRKMHLLPVLVDHRRKAAEQYRAAISGYEWLTPQHVPDGWTHDYWCFTVALSDPDAWHPLANAIVRHGGEHPYGAWRLSFDEPALRYMGFGAGGCSVARQMQPRLMQFQTNDLVQAAINARALRCALKEVQPSTVSGG